jgi:hypothetical protein
MDALEAVNLFKSKVDWKDFGKLQDRFYELKGKVDAMAYLLDGYKKIKLKECEAMRPHSPGITENEKQTIFRRLDEIEKMVYDEEEEEEVKYQIILIHHLG